jgi:hypothetical protein
LEPPESTRQSSEGFLRKASSPGLKVSGRIPRHTQAKDFRKVMSSPAERFPSEGRKPKKQSPDHGKIKNQHRREHFKANRGGGK